MPTTVFFATNRVVFGPSEQPASYTARIVAPSDPAFLTYGVAHVDGIDIASNAQGNVTWLGDTATGDFADNVRGDLAAPGRNLFVFIHGFDNTFSDAITRAAFNREWLAAAGPTADATVIAFSWPSCGQIVAFPVVQGDYLRDQTMATQSGVHLMTFLSRLQPVIAQARATGRRTTLLAHSMGAHALEAAVESWFMHGNSETLLFDEVVLAAGDCRFDTLSHPEGILMGGLGRLCSRISIYFSGADQVLQLSEVVNIGAQRLGQQGPRDTVGDIAMPRGQCRIIDCGTVQDHPAGFLASHQYYRQSPIVRADLAAVIGGAATATRLTLP